MEKIYVSPGEWCEHPGYGRELMYRAADVQALAKECADYIDSRVDPQAYRYAELMAKLRAIVEGK